MAGANPTLTAITTEASRGGLFDRSNVATPVSGSDIQGTIVNDSTISLTLNIDGTPHLFTFTTNQATDVTQTISFTTTGTGGTGDSIVSGSFDPDTMILTLTRASGSPFEITGFTFEERQYL